MLPLKTACESTTAHGLPRIVTGGKPIFMRIVWLLLFLLFMAFFFRGMIGLVAKLQSPQVSSSLEASSVTFRFPDVYACFENPVSASYAATMDAKAAVEFMARVNDTEKEFDRCAEKIFQVFRADSSAEIRKIIIQNVKRALSHYYPPSMPYQLLVDALAHRAEQSVISSLLAYTDTNGFPTFEHVNFTSFYHPNYLRCFRWRQGASAEDKLLRSGTSAGLVLTLMLDGNDTAVVPVNGSTVDSPFYRMFESGVGTRLFQIPLSEWTLGKPEWSISDRSLGVRIFLTPPGQYPTVFAQSYTLAPGQFHTMDVKMSVNSYSPDQFPCLDSPDGVQFLNPYDQTPYSHEYSYSYCYYYEFHRQFQAGNNISGSISPLPWSLGGKKFVMNLTGLPNILHVFYDNRTNGNLTHENPRYDELARKACIGRDRCSLLVYDATISSADWPTPASLNAYLGTTVATARASAAARGLATPVLDFLVNNPRSAVTANYVRSNLVKVQIRPSRVLCDRLVFAYTYGFENFIADVGGIMGIYLGMSLLTICEVLDLIVDLVRLKTGSRGGKSKSGVGTSSAKVDASAACAQQM